MFEIGELGIVRDIPTEMIHLEGICRSLRAELQKYKNLAGFLGLCLGGVVIYILTKDRPSNTQD